MRVYMKKCKGKKETTRSKLFLGKMRIDVRLLKRLFRRESFPTEYLMVRAQINRKLALTEVAPLICRSFIQLHIGTFSTCVYMKAYVIFPLVYLTRHSLQTAVSGFEYFILRLLIITFCTCVLRKSFCALIYIRVLNHIHMWLPKCFNIDYSQPLMWKNITIT